MARVPQVTRTITTTVLDVMCLDTQSGESLTITCTLPRSIKDDKKALKMAQKVIETETLKAVHIVGHNEVETLYGMTEQDFIKYATPLDEATRKPIL